CFAGGERQQSLYWVPFPPMAHRRVYCTAVQHQGALLALDVETQTWSVLPPMPTARAGASAVVTQGGQVMVLGGMDREQRPLAAVHVYHPDEGKWESRAALGQPAMGVTAVERDGKVLAFGGMGADTSPQALVRVYEPQKDQWLPLPSMPTPRYGASAFARGNKVYVLGGRQGKMPVTALESFDLEVRGWTRLACIPSRRAFSGCVSSDSSLFSLGGLQQPGPHNFYSRPHFVSTVEDGSLLRYLNDSTLDRFVVDDKGGCSFRLNTIIQTSAQPRTVSVDRVTRTVSSYLRMCWWFEVVCHQ
uniref:Kelch domain-containing protein 8B n=1 Tax=Neogobius melanostomus TaxID=47308 RepID=A0A8C6WZ49_9GOBI